ncbi:Streptomycin 3''-adenylyltransferase [Legionella geestiana]|uniref:Aminoglycoside (3'') (9) adenylyltransferase n=1 Tax=Legionella geestiana TaxID=45065 RepID=A0A0W0TJU6_9GAMM|nr:aminoglycoside adenylyltransferase family protein [Legionella geestiana]KTC95843.1 Streptomycin 3''-adenylyltransferase [Legionella geestiana]QBS13255.1 DUF4111 domain-containing protein [Legionella geestiana]QDQ40847.1 DUF4111 domain-containing protein [Legionella geestiana]STX54219.1 Streptomycin 3''-adenylyltransferase [Legionella geestiana]
MALKLTLNDKSQIHRAISLLTDILGNDLLGAYLYGSCLVGGLQKYSDIDFLAVINRPTTSEEKRYLISGLLKISGIYMKSDIRPLEMTLVEKSAVNPWRYPPHCDFQYGEWLREAFESGDTEPLLNTEMPDVALIIQQVLLESLALSGPKPAELLAPVPYEDFIHAMLHDLERLYSELEEDTRNVLLTLARIWSTFETDAIRSKPAAADWAIARLPETDKPVMQRAKAIYLGLEPENWDDLQPAVKSCAVWMIRKVHEHKPANNRDVSSRAIHLAENTSV